MPRCLFLLLAASAECFTWQGSSRGWGSLGNTKYFQGREERAATIGIVESWRARRGSPAVPSCFRMHESSGGASESEARRNAIKFLAGGVVIAGAGKGAAAAGEEGLIRALDGSMKASIGFLDTLKGKSGIPKPAKRQLIRPRLSPAFARRLADAIAKAAVDDEKLFPEGGKDELVALETSYAQKCVSFFPGAGDALSSVVGWTAQGGGVPPLVWDALFDSEVLCNLAIYARLRTISRRTLSPLSRKKLAISVANRVLSSNVLGDSFNPENFTVSGGNPVREPNSPLLAVARHTLPVPLFLSLPTTLQHSPVPFFPPLSTTLLFTAPIPLQREDLSWLEGVKAMLASYTSNGYGVGTIGEGKYGVLDELVWREDGRAAIQLFFYDVSLLEAAQVHISKPHSPSKIPVTWPTHV